VNYKNLAAILAENLGMLKNDVERIISTAPYRYKVYQIPKRKKGEYRIIAQPAFEVKLIQRWLVSNLLAGLPIHESAAAYIKGAGIKDNALKHSKNKYIMKMDFSNFFPSIGADDIYNHLEEYMSSSFTVSDYRKLCRLLVRRNKESDRLELSIGAPSSPFISNSIMYDFDIIISDYCKKHKVIYTRYADDLTFSTRQNDLLKKVEKHVHEIVGSKKYPFLKINQNKTVHTSTNRRRIVTGLFLTPEGNVSIGRDRKRAISAKIHRYTCGLLDESETKKLKGLLAFALDAESEFISKMELKYGKEIINSLIKRL